MSNPIGLRKWIFLSVVTLLAASAIPAGVVSHRKQQPTKKLQKPVVELPPVVSHVPKLRIANINVENQGTPDARVAIEILNTSHLAVMYVEISTKNKAGDSGAVNEDGLIDPNNPVVVIPAFGTKTLGMNFSEMVPDSPLAISAAVFSDGTEEGQKWALREMRLDRARHQKQLGIPTRQQNGGAKP